MLGGILGNQARARGGDHDGVDDHVRCIPSAQAVCDDFDNLGRGDHADLDGARADIVKDGVNLRGYDIWRDILHGGDARVFCAVMAVMAVSAYRRCAVMVLMSA